MLRHSQGWLPRVARARTAAPRYRTQLANIGAAPRHRARLLSALIATWLVLAALAIFSPSANAYSYRTETWAGCGGGYSSGAWDDAGYTYIPCGSPSTIGRYAPDGTLVQSIPLNYWTTDVAPSPDGKYLYTARGGARLSRLVRQSNGSYVPDTGWVPANYPYGDAKVAQGHFVAVDGAGNVYLADGAWSNNNTHTVIKYNSAGQYVTRFGDYANSWGTGTFYWMLTGLAVTRDGSKVYTSETGNNRIQTWARQGNGSYNANGGWGGTSANNADRQGYCDFGGWLGKFAAPYDVSLDSSGNVYVINTTCKQVMKFNSAGTYVSGTDIRLNGGDYPRPHGFAVAADGTVYIGENQKVLRRSDKSSPSSGNAPQAGASFILAGHGCTTNCGASSGGGGTNGGTGGGSTGGGSSPKPPAGGGQRPTTGESQPDKAAPRIGIRLSSDGLVGRRSLPVVVGCSEACTMNVTVWYRSGKRKIVVARTSRSLTKASSTSLVMRASRKWVRAERHPGRVVVEVRAQDRTGNASSLKRTVRVDD